MCKRMCRRVSVGRTEMENSRSRGEERERRTEIAWLGEWTPERKREKLSRKGELGTQEHRGNFQWSGEVPRERSLSVWGAHVCACVCMCIEAQGDRRDPPASLSILVFEIGPS